MDQPNLKSQINLGSISGIILIIVTIIVAIIHYKQVSETLDPDITGIWLLFLSIGNYLIFFDLGISPTLSREIAFLTVTQHKKNIKETNDIITTCIYIYICIAIVLATASIFLGVFFFHESNIKKDNIILSWAFFVIGTSINLIGNISYAILTGKGNIATERIARTISMLIWLFSSTIALIYWPSLMGLSIAWLIYSLISRLIIRIILSIYVPTIALFRGSWNNAIAKKIYKPSSQWALTQLGSLFILQTGILVIAWNLDLALVLPYDSINKIMAAAATIALVRSNASITIYSKLSQVKDLDNLKKIFYGNIHYSLITMSVTIGFMSLFGLELIDIWLGSNNFVGYPTLFIILITITLEVHHVTHANLTMATGKIPFVKAALYSGIINIILSIILVNYFGIIGVAIATMTAQILTNNWYAPYITLQIINIQPLSYLFRIVPSFIFFTLFSILAQSSLWYFIHEESSFIQVTFGIILSIIIYISYLKLPFRIIK